MSGNDLTPEMRAAAQAREEELHLRAIKNTRGADIQNVTRLHANGMSRKRLIQIYGSDLVDMALARA